MKRVWLILCITGVGFTGISCNSVKNLRGTLTKSDSENSKEEVVDKKETSKEISKESDGRVDYSKMKTYAQLGQEDSTQTTAEIDSIIPAKGEVKEAIVDAKESIQSSEKEHSKSDKHKSDKKKMKSERSEVDSAPKSVNETSAKVSDKNEEEANQEDSVNKEAKGSKIESQYAEMDRLAEVVLYELKIVEKRYDKLISKYKSASGSDKNRISDELDRLSEEQIILYRAYVRIYKDGKSNWSQTKSKVEGTLMNLRGISNE